MDRKGEGRAEQMDRAMSRDRAHRATRRPHERLCRAVNHVVCATCGHIFLVHDDDPSVGGCLGCMMTLRNDGHEFIAESL